MTSELLETTTWIPVAEQPPPASNKDPLRSERVMVACLHPRFGWIFDFDCMNLGEHRYWFHGTAWTHWRRRPRPPHPP